MTKITDIYDFYLDQEPPWASVYDNLCHDKCNHGRENISKEAIGAPLAHLVVLEQKRDKEHTPTEVAPTAVLVQSGTPKDVLESAPLADIIKESQTEPVDIFSSRIYDNYEIEKMHPNISKIFSFSARGYVNVPRFGADAVCDFFFKTKHKPLKGTKIILEIGGQSMLVEDQNFLIKKICEGSWGSGGNDYYLVGSKKTSWPVPLCSLAYHEVKFGIQSDTKIDIIGYQATFIYYENRIRDILKYDKDKDKFFKQTHVVFGPYKDILAIYGLAGAVDPFKLNSIESNVWSDLDFKTREKIREKWNKYVTPENRNDDTF